jgi:hypothetical protein
MKASNDAAKSLVEPIDEWEKTVINRQRSKGAKRPAIPT